MRTILFLLFFIFSSLSSFSQHFILDKRSKIKKNMEHFYTEQNRKYSFAETDSTITYVLNDSLSLPVTTIFYFNNQSRCIMQDNIYSCDSCLQKARQQFLDNKFVNWKIIGLENYYAGFPYNTLMQQIRVNAHYILRLTWLKRKLLKE